MIYINKDSFLHKAHPSSKIAALMAIFFFALFNKNLIIILSLLSFILLISLIAGILNNIKKIFVFSLILVAFSSVMWLIFYPKEESSYIALTYGIKMSLRLILVFFSGIAFLSVTRIEEFIYGIRKFYFPYKLCFAISLAFRLIPLIYENTAIVIESQRIKGVDLKSGHLIEKVKKYAPLLSPIISLILREANFITIAVEARGFSYPAKKTEYLYFSVDAKDIMIILFALSLICLTIIY